MARDRDQQHDLSNTLTMLHATLVQTGSNLQDALTRGLEKVETGNQTAQRGTTDMVVAELSRMRTDLRDTKNRLAANREELSEEVRTALTLLRQEIHKVKDAVENAPATEAEPPESGALPSSDDPYTPVPPHPDGAPGPATPAIQPAATVTDPPPAPDVQNTDLPLTHSVSLPAQRSSDENDQTPDAAEQLQQALRTVLADELRDLLTAVAGVQQSQASALNEQRQELAGIRGELVALAANLEGWQVRQTATGPDTDAPEVTEGHSGLLQQAARISSAVLVCHRDMWEFVAANAGRHPHFRIPPQITDHGGERVSTTVSGRSLIAVLISLYDITHTAAKGDGDWELATTLYGRIQHQLTTLDSDGDPVTITLDDRAQPTRAHGKHHTIRARTRTRSRRPHLATAGHRVGRQMPKGMRVVAGVGQVPGAWTSSGSGNARRLICHSAALAMAGSAVRRRGGAVRGEGPPVWKPPAARVVLSGCQRTRPNPCGRTFRLPVGGHVISLPGVIFVPRSG